MVKVRLVSDDDTIIVVVLAAICFLLGVLGAYLPT